MKLKPLELLAPAANAEIAIQAILHGADAVYIGASSHGARKSASNSVEDIKRVVEFAHQYRAKVYVTVNTIVYESELHEVERLCRSLYLAGVDALIVQDMSLLRLDIPPIALHASTQCDIRTPDKARFLQDVGFSQLVLARELTLEEIRGIAGSVDVPVECFVHGALCVSYSGRCHASCAATGRSANRGECAQICRLPFTLTDNNGKVVVRDRHLLSLRDFNASAKVADLVAAGVSSFKIEGRLKDVAYVKNIVGLYSSLLNDIIRQNPEKYVRSSYGNVELTFQPQADKSFNRGFTDYFLSSRTPDSIASLMTPKSMGEKITDLRSLNNGDGISFFDRAGEYQGVNVNRVEKGRIITGRKVDIPRNAEIRRTFDNEWQKKMAAQTAVRKLDLKITMDEKSVSAEDERGVKVILPLDVTKDTARKTMDYKDEFAKLGNTPYVLKSYASSLDSMIFIPKSEIAALRRNLVKLLDQANVSTYRFDIRRQEKTDAMFPSVILDFRDNVANSLAEKFYRDHGVKKIERALETGGKIPAHDTVLMTTRHCVLRELGMCKKKKPAALSEPLHILSGNRKYSLRFNCRECEMQVLVD